MNKGNTPPPMRLNTTPGLPWRTYSQCARALAILIAQNQPTGSVNLVIPSRALTPFAAYSLNSVLQYHLPVHQAGANTNCKIQLDLCLSSKANGQDTTPTKYQAIYICFSTTTPRRC
ncbi:uncharacterized protein MELLADRAFT_109146 [Melampsora larici-populina 98AG31]|uniref:Uncharacterized protein n=1 Tax=Melampsora larici-populina (strain 98AG31 / pathotype 3-4-7) TaxID=747676 RepID=F4RVG3_MELLP|nr:uncharacterized protein MELLADRAFT_109146 [Melampsora larici-populina 98AG31]EGG03619.1 hypothetical protein MELLADRAFT_109146 [Melampsora larici-populina 98AG31]